MQLSIIKSHTVRPSSLCVIVILESYYLNKTGIMFTL